MKLSDLVVKFIDNDLDREWLDPAGWRCSEVYEVRTYWNGEIAPSLLWFTARLLWSERYFYVRFETGRSDDMVVSSEPKINKKTIGLWERDVCEIFIAPDRSHPASYFEFEIAPTGEWLDLAIDMTGRKRKTDWEYRSGMEASACIEKDRVVMAMRIPWTAFSTKPRMGEIWLANFFRCVAREPDRGYLAHRPTLTEIPDFHVPESFGQLMFDN